MVRSIFEKWAAENEGNTFYPAADEHSDGGTWIYLQEYPLLTSGPGSMLTLPAMTNELGTLKTAQNMKNKHRAFNKNLS